MMKVYILLISAFLSSSVLVNAQKSTISGHWQLTKVVQGEKIYNDLKSIFVFEKDGILKTSRSSEEALIEVGKWKYNKKSNAIIMNSSYSDKDFNGEASLILCSESILIYKKDDAELHFVKLEGLNVKTNDVFAENTGTVERLSYDESAFFTKNGDFNYEDDEGKLPWQSSSDMIIALRNVSQLVYNYSSLDIDNGVFTDKTLTADVHSSPQDYTLSIDYIFYGYDRYNLPDDVALPPNDNFEDLLYPEQDHTFRITGNEQLTTPAGSFDCTVIEVLIDSETRKKLWMINNKPGIYAKIIDDKSGMFGHYTIYLLQKINNQ